MAGWPCISCHTRLPHGQLGEGCIDDRRTCRGRQERQHDLHLYASEDRRTIFNDTSVATLGRIELRSVTTTGRVQILARDKVRGGHVDVRDLDIVATDARAESERPHGYGVYVLHGAFTLWNMQPAWPRALRGHTRRRTRSVQGRANPPPAGTKQLLGFRLKRHFGRRSADKGRPMPIVHRTMSCTIAARPPDSAHEP